MRAFVLESWPGRILCGALGLLVLDFLYVPLPCGLGVLYKLSLVLLLCWFTFRLGRYLVKRLEALGYAVTLTPTDQAA